MTRKRLVPCAVAAVTTLATVALEGGGAFLGGLVVTERGQPLGGAQVIVEPLDGEHPVVAYTNPQGLFRFAFVPSRQFMVRANAYGFEPRALAVDLMKDSPTVRLEIPPASVAAPGSGPQEKTVVVTSGAKESGWGADWSPTHTLCGEAEKGYRIRSHSFELRGDRSCGAWAECSPSQQRDTRVCWDFRLQGHSESVLFGQAVRQSEGVLTLVLEASSRRQQPSLVTVYLLCSPETAGPAHELRATLVGAGWRVAELQTLDAPFPSRIVRAGLVGKDLEAEIAELAAIVRVQEKKGSGLFGTPSLEFHAATAGVPPDVVEVWLAPVQRVPRRRS